MKYAITSDRGFVTDQFRSGAFQHENDTGDEPLLFDSVRDAVRALQERSYQRGKKGPQYYGRFYSVEPTTGMTIVGVREVLATKYEEVEL